MAIELAKAYLPIIPSLGKGFKREVEKQLGPVEAVAEKTAHSMGHKISKGIKVGAAAAAASLTGLLGTALVKGFGRLSAIENAESKLSGLGNTAEDVSAIMDNALTAVKGTAFGMDEAATTAASAVAAGIKPGKDLAKYLGLVGDAATIAGTDMASMGSIFNKVATSGKVQGDVFAQLSDAGIPVVQMLAKEMGITAEEVYKLGSEGKISSDTFLAAMSSMQGAALKGGETTSGAFKNMNAALGRFGATLLKDIFPLIRPIFGFITEKIDLATNAVGPLAEALASTLVGAFTSARDLAAKFGAVITDNWNIIGPILAGIGASVATFLAWQGALKLVTIATTLWGAATTTAGAALAFVTSPIGIAVIAIGALTAGIIWAYNNLEWFRDLVQVAWANIQVAIGAVVDWWTATAWPAIQTGLRILGDWFTWLWQEVITPAWSAIATVIQQAWITYIQPALAAVWSFIQGTLGPIFIWLWQTIIAPTFKLIVAIIQWAWSTMIVPLFNLVVAVVRDVLAPIFMWLWRNIITPVWNGIVIAIQVAWKIIEVIFGLVYGFLKNVLGPVFKWFWESIISPVWSWISDKISTVGSFIADKVFPKLSGALEVLKGAFEKTKNGIGRVWDGLKNLVKEPISWVINTVINDGLIAGYNKLNNFWTSNDEEGNISRIELGFARGGTLPGYQSAKKDELLVPMRKGEGVLVPEATRALGSSFIHGLNAAANAGGVGAAKTWLNQGQGAAAGTRRGWAGSESYSTGAPPSGRSGIWGAFQNAIASAGRLFVPKTFIHGVNTEDVAKAWIGRSALPIIMGTGSPSVSFGYGTAGPWGFNNGSSIQINPGSPRNMALAILRHELGHALSLHHTDNPGSIMHPAIAGTKVPTSLDYGALVKAWGAPGAGVKTYDVGDGGGFDFLGVIAEKITGLTDKAIDAALGRFEGNGFVEMPVGIAKKSISSAVEWVKDKLTGGFALGGIVGEPPALYDKGGIINRGVQLIDHQRATPDYVLTDQQWAAMYEIAQSSASAQQGHAASIQIGSVHGYTVDEVAAQIEKERRQKMALAL
ncbi:tape measure protein [Rothia sp. CCM 9416]|uniref:tape measure protein n=1 Tax=Rothia sp. CCM 9416 TaxID=3402655 RepID=UPI003AD8D075